MPILTSLVFLGATLLFGMEPLTGRILLPYFGGAAHVWLTSLMFFQAMLLVGYLYAHLLAQKLGRWHLLLLLLPLVNLPLAASLRPGPETPLLTLLAVLLSHFALPFAVLSTTAVVAQSWLSRSAAGCFHEPYPLYAASNAGSLLALFGFAFLAEPLLGVKTQSLVWTGGYLIYAVLVVAAWFALRPGQMAKELSGEGDPEFHLVTAPGIGEYTHWFLLSALPSGFLLTVTNFIAQEMGSFPLVWVFPLAFYLGSFVVVFRNRGVIPRFIGIFWPELVIVGVLLYLLPAAWMGWFMTVIGPLLVLLGLCLVAHGELYERRPPVRFLTHYYLTMAAGGFLGGAFVSLGAPYIFSGLYEYPIFLAGLAYILWRCHHPFKEPVLLPGLAALRHLRAVVIGLMLGLTLIVFIGNIVTLRHGSKFRHRNFYGTYLIYDLAPEPSAPAGIRLLVHGKTNHGAQLLDPNQRNTPLGYYHGEGAIAAIYETKPAPRRIAVIGLGAGVVSTYICPGDHLTYFEIDPDNEKIARDWFTFLAEAGDRVRVAPGDGRLSLQETAKEINFDIILVDAFSGDGIPIHLLTREALEVYLGHLAEDGLIQLHISNRYYDLRSVVKATASELHLAGAINIPDKTQPTQYKAPSQCVVLARSPGPLKLLLTHGWVPFGEGDGLSYTAPWTDDYINIIAPLWAKLWPCTLKAADVPKAR